MNVIKYLLASFILFCPSCLLSQSIVITLDWNTNIINEVLPYDEKFFVKLENVPKEEPFGLRPKLKIWEVKNEKRIVRKISKKRASKNKTIEISFEDDILQFPEELKGKECLNKKIISYSSQFKKISEGTYLALSPVYLKPNRSYYFSVDGGNGRAITEKEQESLVEKLDREEIIENELDNFINAYLEIPLSKLEDDFSSEIEIEKKEKVFIEAIEAEIKKADSNILFRKKSKEDNFKPLSNLLDSLDEDLVNALKDLEKNNSLNVNILEIRRDLKKQKELGLDTSLYVNLNESFDAINEQKKDFVSVFIKDYINEKTRYTIAHTFAVSLDNRYRRRFTTSIGAGYTFKHINKPFLDLGVNFHFRPQNERTLFYNPALTLGEQLLKSVSIRAAITVLNINGDLFQEYQKGLLNNQSIMLGLNYQIAEGIYLSGGALGYFQSHSNPLIDKRGFKLAGYISASIDIRIRDIIRNINQNNSTTNNTNNTTPNTN